MTNLSERTGSDDVSAPQDPREARIQELRARRRARLRALAIRSTLVSSVLVLLAAGVVYWLLTTFGGRDFLMAQIVARLPAGTELTWQRAEGRASGPLTLHGVRYVQHGCPELDGKPIAFGHCSTPTTLVFTAKRVAIDPDIRPLFGKRLRLDVLDIDGATLQLPKSDAPFELPRWPESLPHLVLPLALQADTIRINGFKVEQAGESLIDIRSLRGGLDAQQGALHLEHIVAETDHGHFIAHGDYAPRDDYAMDLTVGAVLPAAAGRTRPRFGLAARGDLSQMDISLFGNAPSPVHAQLTLRGKDNPHWTMRANTQALDLALISGKKASDNLLAFDLSAHGVGGRASVQGRLTQGDFNLVLQPSKVRIEDQVLEFSPLIVDVVGGRITARGRGDFNDPANAVFKFSVIARKLMFGAASNFNKSLATDAPSIFADADFGIAGTTKRWAAIGNTRLMRDQQAATIDFDGRGDAQLMRFKTLHVAMPSGALDAAGLVRWQPALGWNLDAKLAGFDPGYFAPDWKGAINGILKSTAVTLSDGGLNIAVDAQRLGGALRGRKLDGHASFQMRGAAPGQTQANYSGDIALSLGSSRIDAKGKVTDTLDIDARVSPLQLADFLPGAGGILNGALRLTGTRNAPDIEADLIGKALAFDSYRADALTVRGKLPWRARSGKSSNGTFTLNAIGVQAGLDVETLQIEAQGAVEQLNLRGTANSAMGALDIVATTHKQGANWNGALESFLLTLKRGASWQLQSPARYAQQGTRWTLSESCFASSGGGSLCANVDWPQRGLHATGRGLPLALVTPYLPEREDQRPWLLRGEIALDARLRPAGNAYAGNVVIASASGGLRLSQRARRDLIGYDNFKLDADFDAKRVHATLSSAFNGKGHIDADITTGWDAYAPLSGSIAVNTDQLTVLELFSPDIVEPTGQLDGRITLAGTRAQPALGGQAQLRNFATDIPSLGIVLQEGSATLSARADGTAAITGNIRSGEGILRLDGTLGWRGDATTGETAPLVLHVSGENVLVSATRDLRAVANPDLTVRYVAAQPLAVNGTVTIPSALIDLERLDAGVSASPDVVVLDPVNPRRVESTSSLDLDLTLRMGDDVKLRGFGLDGTLGGSLRVRAQPGREMTAAGALDVGGRYTAYGQKLQITRGELQWSNGPVSDPILNIRAERRIEAQSITAGIDVTGRATAPQANVWSDPATDDSEALSYLALGRSTSNLSSSESEQLNAASTALTAGGSLLASQIGSKIGLDDAGVMDSRALGGSVLGIGKQLSPRLYVGFGVSLLGTGQVLTLKYLLKKGFDVEIESSTIENRGSVNWRKEK